MFRTFVASLFIAVVAVFNTASPVAEAVEPVMVSAPVTMEDAPEYVETPVEPRTTGIEWIDRELAQTDIVVPANVHFILRNDALNCGAQASQFAQGGCTHWLEDGSVLVVMSPELADTPQGKHILFHELGHVMLDTQDECMADYYALSYAPMANWAYAECHS